MIISWDQNEDRPVIRCEACRAEIRGAGNVHLPGMGQLKVFHKECDPDRGAVRWIELYDLVDLLKKNLNGAEDNEQARKSTPALSAPKNRDTSGKGRV